MTIRRIAVVDPSAFTIPYDDHLCRGLVDVGCEVTLLTRPFRRNNDCQPVAETDRTQQKGAYAISHYFYRFSERLATPAKTSLLTKGVKAVEHVWNMADLARFLKRFGPEVVHFQWSVVPAIDGVFLRSIRKVAPCVLTVHDTNAFLAPTSGLQRLGWHSLLNKFDRLIVHTQMGKAALVDKGVDKDRIATIPHGVFDLPDQGELRSPSADADCVVLAFGSIKPYKGIDILFRALHLVRQDPNNRIRLLIAGSPGDLEGELRQLAHQLQISDLIEWRLGFVPDEEVPALFARSNAVVFPYREIDASGALMTALPYAKPIIASRLGLFAELLEDGKTAHLVEPNDPESLAEALESVVRDRTRATEIGRRAAALADDVLSWRHIAELTLAAYSKACNTQ